MEAPRARLRRKGHGSRLPKSCGKVMPSVKVEGANPRRVMYLTCRHLGVWKGALGWSVPSLPLPSAICSVKEKEKGISSTWAS